MSDIFIDIKVIQSDFGLHIMLSSLASCDSPSNLDLLETPELKLNNSSIQFVD